MIGLPPTYKAPLEALGAAANKSGIYLDLEQCTQIISRMYDVEGRLRTFEEIMGINPDLVRKIG